MKNNTAAILGCRGSVPAVGKEYEKYGGATSCFAVKTDNQLVIIDAGSGILKLAGFLDDEKNIPILFTHAHVDHLIGFPMCSPVFNPENRFEIYSPLSNILENIMKEPLWPVGPEQLPSEIVNKTVSDEFYIGSLKIMSIDGNHPGGVKIYRICGEKSVVIMTDCTISSEEYDKYLGFAKDCDLLLIDGQYSEDEWCTRKTFGHNSYCFAAKFAADANAKITKIVHHSPDRSDADIDEAKAQISAKYPNVSFAYEGEFIEL